MVTGAHEVSSSDDQKLLALARAGDHRAFSFLAARYRPLLCAVATSEGGGDPTLAEDAAQEALAVAWEKLEDLRDPERLRSWLCGIARNVLRYRRRHGARHAPDGRFRAASEAADLEAAGPSPLELLMTGQRHRRLLAEVGRLPEGYRMPLLLFYGEGLSVRRVAEVLRISEETVRQRLARGRRRLRERVPRAELAFAPFVPLSSAAPPPVAAAVPASTFGWIQAAVVACGIVAAAGLATTAAADGEPAASRKEHAAVRPLGSAGTLAARAASYPLEGPGEAAPGASVSPAATSRRALPRPVVEPGEPILEPADTAASRSELGNDLAGPVADPIAGSIARPALTLAAIERAPAPPELGPLALRLPSMLERVGRELE